MKTLSEPAQAAKLIRSELKKAFPGIKFSVTTETYSMGNSIYISYDKEKLTRIQIESIADKYKAGSFDGMTDSYNFRNSNDLPKAMFISYRGY